MGSRKKNLGILKTKNIGQREGNQVRNNPGREEYEEGRKERK